MPDSRDDTPRGAQSPGRKATTTKEGAPGTSMPKAKSVDVSQVAVNGTSERQMDTPSHAPSSGLDEAKRRLVRSKPKPLGNLHDLLNAAYSGKRKRLNPQKSEIAAMRSAARLVPSEQEDLLLLSASDRTLERTRDLMLLSFEWSDVMLAGQVREFISEVLRRHPAFLSESLAGVFSNNPDGISEDDAVRTLGLQSFAALSWPEGLVPLVRKEAEQCRLNAIRCLLLWFRRTRGISLERIQGYLQSSIWGPAARRYKTDAQKLRVLMSARDPGGIGIASSVFEKEAHARAQQAATAIRAAERATLRAKELEDKLSAVDAQLETARGEVEDLSQKIIRTTSAHQDAMAHMVHDYDTLQGRVLGRLKEEVSLLDEGLHALRRDPPKVRVMEDHAERVLDGLKSEIERLMKKKGD